MRFRFSALPFVLACGAFSAVGCATTLTSREAPTSVDGDPSDWRGSELLKSKNAPLEFSVQHDEHSLFVYLSAPDGQWLRHAARDGLTIHIEDGIRVGFVAEPRLKGTQPLPLTITGPEVDGPRAIGTQRMRERAWSAEIRLPRGPESEELLLSLTYPVGRHVGQGRSEILAQPSRDLQMSGGRGNRRGNRAGALGVGVGFGGSNPRAGGRAQGRDREGESPSGRRARSHTEEISVVFKR